MPRLSSFSFPGPDPRRQLDRFLKRKIPAHQGAVVSALRGFEDMGSANTWYRIITSGSLDGPMRREILDLTRNIAEEALLPAILEAMLSGDRSLDSAGVPLVTGPRRLRVRQRTDPTPEDMAAFARDLESGMSSKEAVRRMRERMKGLDATQSSVMRYLTSRAVAIADYLGRTASRVTVEIIRGAVREYRMGPGDAVMVLQNSIGLDERTARRNLLAFGRDLDSGMSSREATRRMKARTERSRIDRAQRVLDYEMSRAWNQGTLEGVKERKELGLIDPAVVKVWLTVGDDRVCPVCAPLHLMALDPNDEFSNRHAAREILGGLDPTKDRDTLRIDVSRDVRTRALLDTKVQIITASPPAHVRCRCVLAYRRSPLAKSYRQQLMKAWAETMFHHNQENGP